MIHPYEYNTNEEWYNEELLHDETTHEYNYHTIDTVEKRQGRGGEYEICGRVDSSKSLALSHASSYDYGLSPSVSIQDLEENNPYEIHWHVGGTDCVPTYVVANFERKIHNYDPRDTESCTDFDLVFQHLKNGNYFTIHSDLVDEGIVDFYVMATDNL